MSWIELRRWDTEKQEWFKDKPKALVHFEYIPKAGDKGSRERESDECKR